MPAAQPVAPAPAALAAAQPAAMPESLENMFLTELPKVTIASAHAESPDEAPANVYVITGQEMVERGYRSLVDVIQDLPGVTIDHAVRDNGGEISIRGLMNNQMFRLMVNGMPIDPVLGSGLNWNDRFPVANIERVEFILGPYPALYGRNTFSGILNVVTKTGAQVKGGELYALYGSWDKGQGTAIFGDKIAGFDVFLSLYKSASTNGEDLGAEYPESYDRKAREGATNPITGDTISFENGNDPSWKLPYDATDVYLRVVHDSGLFLDFDFNRDISPKMGNFYSPLVYLQNRDGLLNETIINGRVGYKFSWNWLESTTTLGYQSYDWRTNNLYNFSFDADGNIIDNVRGEKYYVVQTSEYSFNERLQVKLGDRDDLYLGVISDTVDLHPYKTSNGGIVTTMPEIPMWGDAELRRFTFLNVSLQDEFRFTSYLKAVLGAMWEKSNAYADVIAPRASLVVDPMESMTVKFVYSGGYITPDPLISINQYLGPGQNTLGVSNIKPEYIDSYDLTLIERVGKNIRLTGSVFYDRVKDLVQTVTESDLPAPFNQTYKNLGTTTARGFELTGDFGVTSTFKMFASYGFVNGTADSVAPDGSLITSTYLGNATIHHLKMGFNILLWEDKLNLFFHDLLLGDRWTTPGQVVPGYTLIDVALTTTQAFDKNWFASTRVKNVLDQQGTDPGTGDVFISDPVIPRRTWDVEVGYRF